MASPAAAPKPDAAWVANEFVKRYYEVLAKHPKYLNRFYKEESQFTLTVRNLDSSSTTTVSTTQVNTLGNRSVLVLLITLVGNQEVHFTAFTPWPLAGHPGKGQQHCTRRQDHH
jgi:hypothetical protein